MTIENPLTHTKMYSLDDLLAIMAAVRHSVTGCPWDREQTFQTIAPYTLEEAYEVVEAIEHNDLEHLQEELGDLLYQVIYHARMAEEQGRFDFQGVVQTLAEKLVRRHPHVFESTTADVDCLPSTKASSANMALAQTASEAFALWQQIKATEQAQASILDGVARTLPALVVAQKLQARAARVNFDWPDVQPVLAKIREELDEIEDAMAHGDIASVREEVGDFIFSSVNLARHLGVDAEQSVRECNHKFRTRFAHIERALAAQGRALNECSLAELDQLWNDAKGGGG